MQYSQLRVGFPTLLFCISCRENVMKVGRLVTKWQPRAVAWWIIEESIISCLLAGPKATAEASATNKPQ